VSVKDLFDVAGQPTKAGSIALAQAAPAEADCPAVARLRAAGAALVGRTNMVEFAFSGVGINPHYGTPVNPADPATPASRAARRPARPCRWPPAQRWSGWVRHGRLHPHPGSTLRHRRLQEHGAPGAGCIPPCPCPPAWTPSAR
jgi:hypothetical protein